MMQAESAAIVFTDLDGSLLDHYSYSFADALPMIEALERLHIPLILVSSKTRAEMLELRAALGNTHPFIVENGAAVYVPRASFPTQPPDTVIQDDCWVHAMAPPRSRWIALLAKLANEFPGEFVSFHSAGATGISEMTGLSATAAEAANARCYSEPVKWLGSARREAQFTQCLRDAGASVFRGGRFLSVSGNCDKGTALRWLRAFYQKQSAGEEMDDIAIGDSENDRPMLEAAGTALVIRSPVHEYPQLTRSGSVIHSQSYGPAGWAEGVSQWLHEKGITP